MDTDDCFAYRVMDSLARRQRRVRMRRLLALLLTALLALTACTAPTAPVGGDCVTDSECELTPGPCTYDGQGRLVCIDTWEG